VRGLERAGSLPAAAAVATESDGATLAIVARSPTGMGVHGVLAGGTWADAADLGSSRNVAEQVMSVIGMQSGDWHDSSTVTWRLAVPSHPLVNRLLEARYVEPLRADPRGEQLLATLWSYLDNDRNVKRTADALVIHENTLRYRLSRLEDLIGGKLDETNRLVELMWVRQALEVDNQPITRP
jgi:putative transposase